MLSDDSMSGQMGETLTRSLPNYSVSIGLPRTDGGSPYIVRVAVVAFTACGEVPITLFKKSLTTAVSLPTLPVISLPTYRPLTRMHPNHFSGYLTSESNCVSSLRQNATDLYLPAALPARYTAAYGPTGVLPAQQNWNPLPVVTTIAHPIG